jgi:hypothetical protein
MKTAHEPAPAQRLTHLSHTGFVPTPGSDGNAAAETAESERKKVVVAGADPEPGNETKKNEATRLRMIAEHARQSVAAGGGDFARRELTLATMKRQEFWLDTCRDAAQMHIASSQVLDLYRSHGCRFFTPSHEQVQEILDALDSAMASWDFEHPELFYQTLELNFSESVRRT